MMIKGRHPPPPPPVALLLNYKALCSYISRFRVSCDMVLILILGWPQKSPSSVIIFQVWLGVEIHSLKRYLLKTQWYFKVLSSSESTPVPSGVQDKGAGTLGQIPLYVACDWHMVESTVTTWIREWGTVLETGKHMYSKSYVFAILLILLDLERIYCR
jgi:hypothetical protein